MYINTLNNLGNTKIRLENSIKHLIEMKKEKLASLTKELNSLSIDSTLQRGFSITETEEGNIVKDIKDININQLVKTRLKGGYITAKVIEKETK